MKKRIRTVKRLRAWVLLLVLLGLPLTASADDHFDPLGLTSREAGIAGLFVFPADENLVVILTVYRGLTGPAPYAFDGLEYTIHMDLDSGVGWNNSENNARYGGTIQDPGAIEAKGELRIRLDNNGRFLRGYPEITGSAFTGLPQTSSGVFDDPFIFPRFVGTNVIGIVMSMPFAHFPAGQQDFVIWATSTQDGALGTKQIDHVGRANRSQLARLDFLNTLHPREHVRAIEDKADRGFVQNSLMRAVIQGADLNYLLQIRASDWAPDVMIFTTSRPAGFPNGRRLEDDIVGLTCALGDCGLQEVALAEGGWPRATTNDKPFSAEFPYLANPHPGVPQDSGSEPGAAGGFFVRAFGCLLLPLVAILLLLVWWRHKKAVAAAAFGE